jgi:hypothetical protein
MDGCLRAKQLRNCCGIGYREELLLVRKKKREMMKLLLGNHQREGSHRWVAKLTIRVYNIEAKKKKTKKNKREI